MTEKDGSDIARSRAKVRKHFQQFMEFIDVQAELIKSGTCLLTGATLEEDGEQFASLVRHVEQLWDASVVLLRSGHFPQSAAMAITCLEEVGKVGVARFQVVIRDVSRQAGIPLQVAGAVSRHKNPFYSHSHKHLLAAGAGAIVNNRLDRILGLARVTAFLERTKARDLEPFRQSCLYADLGAQGPVLPTDRVTRSDALFYAVVAGELMAEVLGFAPSEWERLLAKVQAFEREQGEPWE